MNLLDTLRRARMALERIEYFDDLKTIRYWPKKENVDSSIANLTAAIAELENAKPTALLYFEHGEECFGHPDGHRPDDAQPLYLHPSDDEKLRKDAARYRWLREQHQGVATKVDAEWFEYTEPTEHAWMVFRPTEECQAEPVGCLPGELDAAIDAARAAEGEK